MKLSRYFSKILNYDNLIGIVCMLFVIVFLIYLIIRIQNSRHKKHTHNYLHNNVKERFKNGSYDSSKCEIKNRMLKKDTLYEKVKNVDIVYMWVDGSDKNWQKSMKSNVSSRNRSNNEIIYSLRSISKFMPWHKFRN